MSLFHRIISGDDSNTLLGAVERGKRNGVGLLLLIRSKGSWRGARGLVWEVVVLQHSLRDAMRDWYDNDLM
jgi:hypothetical protein